MEKGQTITPGGVSQLVVKLATVATAAERNNGVGAADRPEYSRALEPRSHAKLGTSHALGIPLKVVHFCLSSII